jgi:HEAT repeat protein
MALFGGNNSGAKPPSFSALIELVKTRGYTGEQGLLDLLHKIFTHPEAHPKRVIWMLSSPNPTIRNKSLAMITKMAGRNTCDILIEAMATSSEQTRQRLAKEIVKVDEQQLARVMSSLVASVDVGQRLLALEIVGAHPKKLHFLTMIKRMLSDTDSAVRSAATALLARGAKNPTIRLILLELIDSDDPNVRSEAIEALSRFPDVDLVEPFFARMPAVERHERNLMTETLSTLAQNPDARMEEHVLPVLADENPEMRDAAVKLLALLPSRTKVLRAYFIHSKGLATWLRTRAAASILKLSDSLVHPLSELLDDEDMDVRVGAMLMIGESDDRSFVPLVLRIFQSDLDWWIRSIAVDVLSKHPSPELVELLLSEMHNPDLRYSIISALGRIDDPQSLRPLLQALNDPARGIRIAVLQALENKSAEDVAPHIFKIARDDEEKKVREKAAAMLAEFDGLSKQYLRELRVHNQEDDDRMEPIGLTMQNEELNDNQ